MRVQAIGRHPPPLQRSSLREEFPRPQVSVVPRGALQPRPVAGGYTFFDTAKNILLALGKPIEIVHQVDQQEFTEPSRERRLHAVACRDGRSVVRPGVRLAVFRRRRVVMF